MSIRCLHTADVHLGAPFPSLGEQEAGRQAAFAQTFERLLTQAIKNEVHLFLVAGDLFDSPRPVPELVGRVQAGLKRLSERGIIPVLLPGTHDHLLSADSVYRQTSFPGAVVLDSPTVEAPVALTVAGIQLFLYGFAYHGSVSADALAGMVRRQQEGIHIGLLHGSRQGSPEWDYRRKDLPFTTATLRDWGLDYVALGHYHDFDVIEEGGRVLACYPGSPEGKRFGENGPRHAALVTVAPGKTTVQKVAANTCLLDERTVDFAGCESVEQAIETIRTLGRSDLLLRLFLTGIVEAPLPLPLLHARCRDAFFHLELEDRTSLFDSDFAQRIAEEETVRGVFVRRARQLMGEMPEDRRIILEEAFREVLVRFHAFGGGEQ